jgi:hypothetical protein
MTADSLVPPDAGTTWFDLRGLTELAMHNTRELIELQMDVWRLLMETQGRAAAAFSLPATYGAVLCGGGQRPWGLAVRSGAAPWLAPAGPARDAALEMQRQFGAVFGSGPASLVAQGWQQAVGRCAAQADAALRQWWDMTEQQVENLGDVAEAGRDALLDAAGPVSDLPREVEVPDASGAKPRRRVAGDRPRRDRAA